MKKKIIALLLIIVVLVSCGTFYLNKVFLPTRIKSLVVEGLKQKTGKDVVLGTLEFNIFKGLVLKELKVYDEKKTLLDVKEAACNFLIFPIFRKQLVIPSISIKSAQIFIHRRSDGTFNIADLFPQKETSAAKPGFNILMRKIKVTGSRIKFQDDLVTPVFNKDFEITKAMLYLSLPASVKFQLLVSAPLEIKASGVFNILREHFSARIELDKLSPQEFIAYLPNIGLKFNGGTVGGLINASLQDKIVSSDISGKIKSLEVTTDKIKTTMNSPLEAKLKYNIKDKKLEYSALLDISDPIDLFLNGIGKISGVKGKIYLNNYRPAAPGFNASLDILTAQAKLDKVELPLTDISGHVELVPAAVRWRSLAFKHRDVSYKTEGALVNFSSPQVELKLASQDLTLESRFDFKDKLINLSKLYGHYARSVFALTGVIDTTDPDNLNARIGGNLKLDLEDLKLAFKNNAKQLEAINPKGIAHVKLRFAGRLEDIKNCFIDADVSGSAISLYGLKSREFFLNYRQDKGLINIPLMHISLYGGRIDASAKMNLAAGDLPYWISGSMQGVKIEELKLDTGAKKEQISGTMQGDVKLNGYWVSVDRLSGVGKIIITEGNLWELNLFKGFGKLLFAKDFSSIIFKEASADFSVENKYITSDNVILKSNLANLTGLCKIGFDGSLNSSIDVEILDDSVPLTGTFKDVATAIIGQSGKFGTIKITGTLKEPKYKFSAAVVNILDTLKNIIIENIKR